VEVPVVREEEEEGVFAVELGVHWMESVLVAVAQKYLQPR